MSRDLGGLMKLTTPFTILNKKFNEMDLIRHAMNSKEKSATDRLHYDYRKIPCIMYCPELKIHVDAFPHHNTAPIN